MSTKRISLAAVVAVAALAACADPSTAPSTVTPRFQPDVPSQALNLLETVGIVRVCSINAASSFTFTSTGGTALTASPFNVAANDCVDILANAPAPVNGNSTPQSATATQTSTAVGFTLGTITEVGGLQGAIAPPSATGGANAFHGTVIIFTQNPVAAGCTFTKGWYRNHGDDTYPLGVDGRNQAQAQAIFDAKPGQPGGVSWNFGNNTLNLYQQTLAAILNDGLTSGITAVANAINASTGAEDGTGLVIHYTSDQTGLIDVLSNFNEGKNAGFPHCG